MPETRKSESEGECGQGWVLTLKNYILEYKFDSQNINYDIKAVCIRGIKIAIIFKKKKYSHVSLKKIFPGKISWTKQINKQTKKHKFNWTGIYHDFVFL